MIWTSEFYVKYNAKQTFIKKEERSLCYPPNKWILGNYPPDPILKFGPDNMI